MHAPSMHANGHPTASDWGAGVSDQTSLAGSNSVPEGGGWWRLEYFQSGAVPIWKCTRGCVRHAEASIRLSTLQQRAGVVVHAFRSWCSV